MRDLRERVSPRRGAGRHHSPPPLEHRSRCRRRRWRGAQGIAGFRALVAGHSRAGHSREADGSHGGWWWGVHGSDGKPGTRCVLPAPGASAATTPLAMLSAGRGAAVAIGPTAAGAGEAALWVVGAGVPTGGLSAGPLLRAGAQGHLDCASAGACARGSAVACDEGKPCTLDGGKAGVGCVHGSDGGSCEVGACKVDPHGKLYRKAVPIRGLSHVGGAAPGKPPTSPSLPGSLRRPPGKPPTSPAGRHPPTSPAPCPPASLRRRQRRPQSGPHRGHGPQPLGHLRRPGWRDPSRSASTRDRGGAIAARLDVRSVSRRVLPRGNTRQSTCLSRPFVMHRACLRSRAATPLCAVAAGLWWGGWPRTGCW